MTRQSTSDTRSPLTAPPLRNPGQSLDEEIHHVIDEEVTSYLLVVACLLFLTIIEWWHWWSKSPPQPLLWTSLTIGVTAYVIRKMFVLRRKVRQLRLARDGERAVGQFLETLRIGGYRVLHDLIGDHFNIDHALIGPAGIFTVETKTYHKPAKGKPEISYDGERITVAGHIPDRDPIVQAKAQAHWLQNILQESTGRRFTIQSIVLYPGWFVKTTVKLNEDIPWVLNPKALPAFLEHCPTHLSDADAQLATYHLSRFMRAAAKAK